MPPKRVYLDKRVLGSSRFNVEDFENHISELLNYCKIIKKQKDTKCVNCTKCRGGIVLIFGSKTRKYWGRMKLTVDWEGEKQMFK